MLVPVLRFRRGGGGVDGDRIDGEGRRRQAEQEGEGEGMEAEPDFVVPAIDWQRTSGKVLTLEWIDGIKLSNRAALIEAGYDVPAIASNSSPVVGKKLSTLKVDSRMSPPTSSGAAVRVFSKVATPRPAPLTLRWGWSFHSPKR